MNYNKSKTFIFSQITKLIKFLIMNFYKKKIMYLSSVGGHLDQLLKIANYLNIKIRFL